MSEDADGAAVTPDDTGDDALEGATEIADDVSALSVDGRPGAKLLLAAKARATMHPSPITLPATSLARRCGSARAGAGVGTVAPATEPPGASEATAARCAGGAGSGIVLDSMLPWRAVAGAAAALAGGAPLSAALKAPRMLLATA